MNSSSLSKPTALIFSLVFASLAWAAEDLPYYDEIFDATGKARPQYEEVLKVYSGLSKQQKADFAAQAAKDFKGDNALDVFPRLLTQSEYDILRKGVEQRGTALRMFLQEYYDGGTSWTQVIPKDIVKRIIFRSGESKYKSAVKPETIAFPYGPDIIRTPQGGWAVIEDNPGYIGGIGDLGIAKDSLLKNVPAYRDAIKLNYEPSEYYTTIVERARARANGGKIVLVMNPPYPDFEDARIAKHFYDLGVIPVTPETGRKLVVKPEGVYLSTPSKTGGLATEERVGFVIMNTEHKWVDKRSKFPGLVKAMLNGKVATNYSPGVDFIGDKEFYSYVDDLVRHYLKEEPVISNLPTHRLANLAPNGKSAVNEKLMNELFKEGKYKDYVFKIVDGRGGDGIWIGPKMDPSEAAALAKKIRSNPEIFIAQKYTHLSVIQPLVRKGLFGPKEEGRIVDLRLITDVGPEDLYVTRTPWGRGVPLGGNGKVNLSDRGREFMVGVVPDPTPQAPARTPVHAAGTASCLRNGLFKIFSVY